MYPQVGTVQFMVATKIPLAATMGLQKFRRRGGRVAECGGLLNRYTG